MEEVQRANKLGRDALAQWQEAIHQNIYRDDSDFIHSIRYYFPEDFVRVNAELDIFGQKIAANLDRLVIENHLASNLPTLEIYNGIGEQINKVVHHPSYVQAGDIIYGTSLMEKIAKPGALLEGLSLFFLSSQAGEAGHNCPIACSAGMLRVLHKVPDFPNKDFYLKKLMAPSYQENFTGAQFLTEVQGGSDVGLNAAYAQPNTADLWRIYGEKWFCSNANADLFFITARYDATILGTKGLGLFLIPANWNHAPNYYTLRRLKEKLGTRSMATAEIDFHGAYAYPMGSPKDGFHLVMENVLHVSRLFNSFTVLGMARRAYGIVRAFAEYRSAFSQTIIHYPLIKENLARIKTENTAMMAGIYDTANLQNQFDSNRVTDKSTMLLLRLLVNIQKYLCAKWSVDHIHHALDILAGNGAIETFSIIPRLLRDSIVCENWEGTHNVLHLQVLKDIIKYNIDTIYFSYMHTELKKLNGQKQYVDIIKNSLNKLEIQLEQFRLLDEDLQSLQIRLITHRMAVLYCALRLLFEAIDQEKTQGSSSKLDCLNYFLLLHLNENTISYNHDYLALMTRIVKLQ